jgi:hypothetical protein
VYQTLANLVNGRVIRLTLLAELCPACSPAALQELIPELLRISNPWVTHYTVFADRRLTLSGAFIRKAFPCCGLDYINVLLDVS